jgi:hypothetical protein
MLHAGFLLEGTPVPPGAYGGSDLSTLSLALSLQGTDRPFYSEHIQFPRAFAAIVRHRYGRLLATMKYGIAGDQRAFEPASYS